MKRILLITIVLLIQLSSWSQDLEWIKRISSADNISISDVKLSDDGVYFLVHYWDGLNIPEIDPEEEGYDFPDSGSGTALFSINFEEDNIFGERPIEYHYSISSDNFWYIREMICTNDDVILVGVKEGALTIKENFTSRTSDSDKGIFIMHHGDVITLKNTNSVTLEDVDSRSNPSSAYPTDDYLYLAGSFKGNLNAMAESLSASQETSFLAKINIYKNSSGSWNKTCNTLKKLEGGQVEKLVYKNGQISVFGTFKNYLKPNLTSPSNNKLYNYDGNNHYFIAQYNNSFSLLKAHKLFKNCGIEDLLVDNSHNFYLTTGICRKVYLNNQSEFLKDTAFIAKYNSNFEYQWKLTFPLTPNYSGFDEMLASFDNNNRICIFRPFKGTWNFDPNGTGQTFFSNSWEETGSYYQRSFFIGKYNTDGTLVSGGVLKTKKAYVPDEKVFFMSSSQENDKIAVITTAKKIDFNLNEGSENIHESEDVSYYMAVYKHCNTSVVNLTNYSSYHECEGGEIKIHNSNVSSSGVGTLQYQWYKDNLPLENGTFDEGLITNANTKELKISNITQETAGTYKLRVTSRCDIPRFSNEVNFTVTPQTHILQEPIGKIVCEGTSVSFNVQADNSPTYQWQVNTGNGGFVNMQGKTSATLNIENVSPNMAGYQYRCKVTGQNSCNEVYSAVAFLGVNPNPTIVAQPVNMEVCTGASTSMNAVANGFGVVYQWQIKNGNTWQDLNNNAYYNGVNSSSLIFVNASENMNGKQYRCKVSSEGGCGTEQISQNATLTVHPEASIISQPQWANPNMCEGQEQALSVNVQGYGLTFQWQVKNGSTWQNLSNNQTYSYVNMPTLVFNNVPANYNGKKYRCIISNPCSENKISSVATLNVTAMPDIELTASDNTNFCEGNSVNLNANSTGNYTYNWQYNYNDYGSTANNIDVNQSGIYFVKGVTPNGCTVISEAIAVNVYSLPNTEISMLGNSTICQGESVELLAPTGNGSSYQWFKDNSPIENAASNNLNVNLSGNYKVKITNLYGCQNTSTEQSITVTPLPQRTLSSNQTDICQGESTTINIENTQDNDTYQWFKNGTLLENENGSSININQTGIYTVNTTLNNCSAISNEIAINSHSLPNAEISMLGNSTICQGESVELLAPTGNGSSYQWFKDNSPIENAASNNLNVNQSGNYKVKITNLYGCENTSPEQSITVTPLPQRSLSTNQTDICEGESTSINIENTQDNDTYQWFRNGTLLENENGSSININQTGIYTVNTTLNNCSAISNEITINSHSLPNAEISVVGSTTACEGENIELLASSGNGYSYQWFKDNQLINESVQNNYTANQNGAYQVKVSNTYGCKQTSNPTNLDFKPLPNVSLNNNSPAVCDGSSTSLSVEEQDHCLYQWYFNNLEIDNAQNPHLEISQEGLYSVYITNTQTACSAQSENATLTVHSLPNPQIQASAELMFCLEDSIILSLNEDYTDYLWSDNSTQAQLTISNGGTYSVTVTDQNQCQNTAEIDITEQLVATPDICMVTVDTATNKNLIVWEHPEDKTGIAYYNIYKLVSNEYQLLGSIAANDTSEYLDPTSKPSEHSDLYVIASVDECGITGAYSPYHQTMNLSVLTGTENNVSLIWNNYIDEAGGQNPTDYLIYRGTEHLEYYTSITGGLSSYNYNITDAKKGEHFMVVIDLPSECAPLKNRTLGGPYYKSNSNIEDEGLFAPGSAKMIASSEMVLYPNPADDYTIIKSELVINEIQINNAIGQNISNIQDINAFEHKIDVSNLKPGVYTIIVNNVNVFKLIIK